MDTVIQTTGLTKHFGGRPAVDRLDLAVPRGSVFALLGDNGAGKTTTLKMALGLLRPDAGRCTVLEQDAWREAVALRQRVGYVPEKPKFYDWMSVDEVGWFCSGFYEAGYLGRYREQVTRFGLEPSRTLSELSKGQYAKVALALALALDPEVLVLDEPTSGLDLVVRREFLSSMVDLAAEGKTVLISSHQVAEVERVATHAAFLTGGKLLLAGSLDELRQRLVRLSLRHDGSPPDAGKLGKVLDRNGLGHSWTATVLDPDRTAVAGLRETSGVSDLVESSLNLEEAYHALLAGKESRP